MGARLAVAITAALIALTNLVVALWFATPWPLADLITLIAGFIFTRQITHLYKEKRRGRHRSTKADTSDTEAAGDAGYATRLAHYRALASASPSPYPRPGLERPEDGLERVESDMPILAHRSARLCLAGTREYFCAVTMKNQRFGVDAEAKCAAMNELAPYRGVHPHKVPGLECACGFYALPTDVTPTYEDAGYVTLMVELSGTVIEHERGYRAEHQRVIECQVGPCVYCGAEADLLVVRSFRMEQATCAAHKPVDEPGVVYLDIADLAALLPVPVTRAGRRKESV